MGGISTGVGIFSGIDTRSLIDQLLVIESRPKVLAQQRLVQLQSVQAAVLDLNSRLNSLKSAAAKFGTQQIFDSARAQSSNADVLTATASAGATQGTFSFIVDRLVSTQQMLSRGFADRKDTALGAERFIFEPAEGRLDTDLSLSELNGGEGISRGKITITDSAGSSATIDLSRVSTVSEVLQTINSEGSIDVAASVDGGRFVLRDEAGGGGTLRVTEAFGYTTAESLGIKGQADGPGSGGELRGERVYTLTGNTALRSLNDGNGIRVNNAVGTGTYDFNITARDGALYSIDIGDIWESVDGELKLKAAAVSDIAGVIERINEQTGGAVTASIDEESRSLVLTDNTGGSEPLKVSDLSGAAKDLGIVGESSTDTLEGRRLLASMNSTLATNLLGGNGLTSGAFSITARDGSAFNFDVTIDGSVADIIADIAEATGGKVTASLDRTGTGLKLTDNTGGSQNLIVGGDGAEEMGLATQETGVASSTIGGDRLQRRYIAPSTLLSTLNGGKGVGTGTFEIVDTNGNREIVNVTENARTIQDVLSNINSRGLNVKARVNDNGDGILIEPDPDANHGATPISIRDVSGSVARGLNLVGTAKDGDQNNFIDGSFERVIEFDPSDTLDDVVQKINDAKVGVRVSVINDGTGSNPYRLTFTSTRTGEEGRFTLDTGDFDLNLQTLSEGNNARVFFGSDDPAKAVLLSSSTNTIDGAIQGVKIDLNSPSEDPVTLSISRDNAKIESAVSEFVSAFNGIASRIAHLTSYDPESERRGTLLGDSTAQQLRSALFSTIQGKAVGVEGPFQYLSQVGVRVGSGGQLELDADRLRAALEEDPQAVADLFAAKVKEPRDNLDLGDGITSPNLGPDTFSSLGVAEQIVQLAERYTDSIEGVLTRRRRSLDDQIKLQNDRIAAFDSRLASRRAILEQQFVAMERALAQLQSQQGALGVLGSMVG